MLPVEVKSLVYEINSSKGCCYQSHSANRPAEDTLQVGACIRQYCAKLAIGGNEYAAYAKSYATLLCYADGLQTGDISDMISEYGTIFVIECTERVKNDYVPFESLTSVLEQSVRNQRYDCMIQERILQSKIEYDAEKLYQYTGQQLR